MLVVQGKALGRKKPLFDEFSVASPVAGDLTLRSLLGHVVRHEVEAFRNRQAERRLLRALTAKQIDEGLAKGKVDSGGSTLDQKVDADGAIAAPKNNAKLVNGTSSLQRRGYRNSARAAPSTNGTTMPTCEIRIVLCPRSRSESSFNSRPTRNM